MEAKDAVIRASEVMAALESKEGSLSKVNAVLDYLSPKIDMILEDGRKAGRREVVEWLENNKFSLVAMDNYCDFGIDSAKWQAKLKEWGLKEDGTSD